MRLLSLTCALAVVSAVPAAAQDPVKVASGSYKLVSENERVRVLRVTLAPGSTTAAHSHPPHVAVTLAGGMGRISTPDGKSTDLDLRAEQAVMTPPGVHTISNTAKTAMDVIVIELKGTPGTAVIPSARPGMKMTQLLKDERAEVYRVTADPSFQEPAGTRHDYDQVVIPLSAGDVNLNLDGKTISTWKRGDATLIGRGIPHQSQGGKTPVDLIIVSIR